MVTARSSLTTKRVGLLLPGEIKNSASVKAVLQSCDLIIAVDAGLEHCKSLEVEADVSIGDFDSVTSETLSAARAADIKIVAYDQDKDFTDTEAAISYCRELDVDEIVVIGCWGGRRDHELATTLCLCNPKDSNISIWATDGERKMWILHDELHLQQAPSSTLSLIPVVAEVTGITTTGLRWPLKQETIFAHSTRAISNICEGSEQHISIKTGVLLVIAEHNRYIP